MNPFESILNIGKSIISSGKKVVTDLYGAKDFTLNPIEAMAKYSFNQALSGKTPVNGPLASTPLGIGVNTVAGIPGTIYQGTKTLVTPRKEAVPYRGAFQVEPKMTKAPPIVSGLSSFGNMAVEALPRLATTVGGELLGKGKPVEIGTNIDLRRFGFSTPNYVTAAKEQQDAIARGENPWISGLGIVSNKALDVAFGASMLTGLLRSATRKLVAGGIEARIEAQNIVDASKANLKQAFERLKGSSLAEREKVLADLTNVKNQAEKILSTKGPVTPLERARYNASRVTEVMSRETPMGAGYGERMMRPDLTMRQPAQAPASIAGLLPGYVDVVPSSIPAGLSAKPVKRVGGASKTSLTPAEEDIVAKKLIQYDTKPLTRSQGISNTPFESRFALPQGKDDLRIEELKLKLENKGLTKAEYVEVNQLLSQKGDAPDLASQVQAIVKDGKGAVKQGRDPIGRFDFKPKPTLSEELMAKTNKGKGTQEAFGAIGGVEQDEDGNIKFDPMKAAFGVAGMAAYNKGKKFVRQKGIKVKEKYPFSNKLNTLAAERELITVSKEMMKEAPIAGLKPYVAKSGEFAGQLPEVIAVPKGRGLAREFSQRGDEIVREKTGMDLDVETAREKMASYLAAEKQLKEQSANINREIKQEKGIVNLKEQGAKVGYQRGKEIGIASQKNIQTTVVEQTKRKGELKLVKEGIKIRAKKDEIINDLKAGIIKGAEAKKTVQQYVMDNLPVDERGKYINMVRTAASDKDIAKAFIRVDTRVGEIERNKIISDVKKLVSTLPENVSVDYKNKINEILSGVELSGHNSTTIAKLEATQKYLDGQKALGKDVEMPQRMIDKLKILTKTSKDNLTTSQIQGIKDEIELLKKLGQTKERIKGTLYESEKAMIGEDLVSTAKPLQTKDIVKTPGSPLPFLTKTSNKIKEVQNRLKKARVSLRPIDGLAEITGMEKMKSRFDMNYGNYLDHNNVFLAEREALLKKLNLKKENMERIGIYGARLQDEGYGKLENLGITREMADAVVLTPAEQTYYDFGRKWFESDYEGVKQYMNDVYNKDVGKVKNYVSFQTDFSSMSELEIYERFGTLADEGVRRTKTVKKDFAESRTGIGGQKIKVNFDDILLRHKDNVAYMLNMGRDTKMYSEILGNPELKSKLGDLGALAWREWLDLMARKGGVDGQKQIAVLDMLRRNLGAGVMSFKLSSALIQVSSLADAGATIGAKWTAVGAFDVATSRAARQFVVKNFPEIRQMIGDDIAFLELKDSFLGKAGEYGLRPLKALDGLMRSTTAIGAYKKIIKERGLVLDFSNPNKEVIAEVTKLVRQSQGSSSFKDTPLAITKGMFTGNVSVDKLIFQFQSFMLNRWENIERQVWRQGFAKGDYTKGVTSIIWMFIVASLLAEGARRTTRKVIDTVTGSETENDPLISSIIKDNVGNVPIVGNVMNSLTYDSNPVPVINASENILSGAKRVVTGKEPATKIKGALDFGLGVANLATGFPGTSQAGQLIKPTVTPKTDKTLGDIKKSIKQDLESGKIDVQTAKASYLGQVKELASQQKSARAKMPMDEYKKALANAVKEKTISMEDAKKEYVDYTKKVKEEADRALAMKTEYPDKDIKQLVSVYAKALGTDPVNAFRAMLTGEKIDRVEGNAVLLQRMRGAHYLNPGGSEEYIKERLKAMDIPEKNRENYRLEHIVPVSAGGSNADSNLQIIDKDLHESYTPIDIALGNAVKNGKITRKKASELSRGLKVTKILSVEDVINLLK